MNPKIFGAILIIAGFTIAVSYSYLVLYTDYSEEIVKGTMAALAILIGGFIAGVGIALVLGWKRYSEAKRRIEERREKRRGE